MQTDPNWTNFLYDTNTGKASGALSHCWNGTNLATQIQLIDFGASREYSKEFMDDWLRLLQSGVDGDARRSAHYSRKLGYLTGEESKVCHNLPSMHATYVMTGNGRCSCSIDHPSGHSLPQVHATAIQFRGSVYHRRDPVLDSIYVAK